MPARTTIWPSRSRSRSFSRGFVRSCAVAPGERPAVLEVGDLRLDPATRQVWRGPTEVKLSAKEFALLETFMRRPGQVLSRLSAPRARVGLRLRESLERRRRLRPVPARQGRPPVRAGLARDGPRGRLSTPRGGGCVSRLPIRVRLTLAFALVMAVVFAAVGAVLYVRLGDTLDERIADTLEARSTALASDLRRHLAGRLRRGGTRAAARGGRIGRRREQRCRRAGIALDRSAGTVALGLDRRGRGSRRRGLPRCSRLPSTIASSSWASLSTIGTRRSTACSRSCSSCCPSRSSCRPRSGTSSLGRPCGQSRTCGGARERSRQRRPSAASRCPRAHDEVYRLGSTLNEMLDRLDEGLARERRFVADASHELRTPLATLQTELELATRRPRSPDELETRTPVGERGGRPPRPSRRGAARAGSGRRRPARAARAAVRRARRARGRRREVWSAGRRCGSGARGLGSRPAHADRRSATNRAGARKSRRQRISSRPGHGAPAGAGRRRPGRARRLRRGRGLCAGVPAVRVRALQPRRRGANGRRSRPRARHRGRDLARTRRSSNARRIGTAWARSSRWSFPQIDTPPSPSRGCRSPPSGCEYPPRCCSTTSRSHRGTSRRRRRGSRRWRGSRECLRDAAPDEVASPSRTSRASSRRGRSAWGGRR